MATAKKTAKNTPPAMLLPHMKQFVAEWQTPARTYRFSFDEALKRSKIDALAMRRDGHILSLLQARLLPVLGADWCVKSENDQYKDKATTYQKLIEKTPRLLQLRKCLMEAVWFGRYGVQFAFGKVNVDGREMTGITAWKPVNGDKINFREDGTPTIRIMPSFAAKLREQGATVEEPTNAPVTAWNDQGTVLILDKPEYRSRFAIHIHEIEDADFAEPELAGSVGGVGLRHYCYWVWWLRQEIMEWLLSYLEMMGAGGLTIVGYDMSNPNGLNQAKEAFKERATVVYLPIPPGQDKQTNIVQRVEPSGTGNDIFSGWVDGYFNAILTRLIIGQDLSSSSNSTGLGSGVADLQASVKECIHRYDAKNLNETETQQILDVLIQMNEPRSNYGLKCQTVLQKVDPEKGLQSAKQAYDMGASLPESHVLQLANIPEVKDGEKTLTNPQLAHEAGLASMYASQQQGGTMGLEEARRMLGEQGIPEEEQLHHLADMVDNGELEEIDADGGVQYAQPRQQQAGEDDTEPLDEPQEEPQTYAKEDWREETGPRGGRRWVNIKTGRIEYKEPGDERTRGWMAGEDKDKPKETDKGERSVGNPRKGFLTQGAYQTLDKALRGESSNTLQGEGVLSHVMHADKRLLKDQVVSLAAQHGMQIDSRTTKTRALAYIEDKLRTHVSKGKADGSAKSGGEAKQAGSGGDGTGDAAPVASGLGGGSGGGDTGPRSVDTVSAESEQTAVAKSTEKPVEPSGVDGADGGDDLGVSGGQHHKMVDSSLGSAKLGDEVKKRYGDAAKSVHGKLPQAAKDRLEKNLKGLQFHESSDALTKTLTDKSPSLKAKLGDKKAGGAFSKKTGELHLDGGTNIDGQKATHEEVYAHEYAHAIDGSDHELSKHQDWHAAWKAEAGEVSKYATKTPQEGFAEFGRLAYTSGLSNEQLKEKFPKMSEYWEKNELLQEAGGKGGDLVESGTQMEDVFSEPFDSGEVIGDKPLMKQAGAGGTQEPSGEMGDDSFDFGANEKPFEPAPKAEAAKPDPFKSTPAQNEEAFDKFAAKAKGGGLNIPDDFREQPDSGAVSGKPVERDTMAILQAKMKRENEQVKGKTQPEPDITRGGLTWKKNKSGKWAWHEGDKQKSGAYPNRDQSDYAFEAHGYEDTKPSDKVDSDFTKHPEYKRLNDTYGGLSDDQLASTVEKMGSDIGGLQKTGKREFNGNGGRRYGPAMASQGARELGQERLLVKAYADSKKKTATKPSVSQAGKQEPVVKAGDSKQLKEPWEMTPREFNDEIVRRAQEKMADKKKYSGNKGITRAMAEASAEMRGGQKGIESYKFTPLSIFSDYGATDTLEYYKDSWNNRKGFREASFNVGRKDANGVTESMPYDSTMNRVTESYLEPLDDNDPEKAMLLGLAESGECEEYTFRSIKGEFGGEGGQGHAITGSGHAKEVINKATGLFLGYLDRYKPDYVYYTAQGESRASLYEYMSKKIGKYAEYTPYKIEGEGYDGVFVVVKNEKVDDFEGVANENQTKYARLNQNEPRGKKQPATYSRSPDPWHALLDSVGLPHDLIKV